MATHKTPPAAAREPDDLAFAIRMHHLKAEAAQASTHRFESLFLPMLFQHYGGQRPENQDELNMHHVRLCCTIPVTSDGATAIELFAREHAGLTQEERDTLLGWRQSTFVFTICSVSRVQGDVIYVYEPVMQMTLPVLSPELDQNVGRDFVRNGTLLLNRLLPVRDFFITVEPLSIVPAELRLETLRYLRKQIQAHGGPQGVAAIDRLVSPPRVH